MQMPKHFPQEHLIELHGLSPEFVGRIVIYQQSKCFNVEIDIVQSETGKIYTHVKSLYDGDDARELLDLSVHHLKKFLAPK
jgi:hypothetical protein